MAYLLPFLYAVALIYGTDPVLRKLTKSRPYILLDEDPSMIEDLRNSIVDLVVFDRRAQGCNSINSLRPAPNLSLILV